MANKTLLGPLLFLESLGTFLREYGSPWVG